MGLENQAQIGPPELATFHASASQPNRHSRYVPLITPMQTVHIKSSAQRCMVAVTEP
jgi:chorismate mutase